MDFLSRRPACTFLVIVIGSFVGGIIIDLDHPIAAQVNGYDPFNYSELCTKLPGVLFPRFLHIPFLVLSIILLICSTTFLLGRLLTKLRILHIN